MSSRTTDGGLPSQAAAPAPWGAAACGFATPKSALPGVSSNGQVLVRALGNRLPRAVCRIITLLRPSACSHRAVYATDRTMAAPIERRSVLEKARPRAASYSAMNPPSPRVLARAGPEVPVHGEVRGSGPDNARLSIDHQALPVEDGGDLVAHE